MLVHNLAAIVALSASAQLAAAPPPIFSEKSYEEAKQEAADGERIFIVDATAEWCGPCKIMDRTTWVDQSVISWIEEHAVAVQIDVDHQADLAASLKIQAMPTIIAFRDDKEFDRVVGLQAPEELLAWLDGVVAGRRAIDKLRETVAEEGGGAVNIDARYDLARALKNTGDFKQAAEEYAWLWENMLTYKPSMVGVRLSFMLSDMTDLAKASPESMEVFESLRTRTFEKASAGTPDREALVDWIHLNEVVGQPSATVEWYKETREDPRYQRLFRLVARDLFGVLVHGKEWRLAGELHDDPAGAATELAERFSALVMLGGEHAEPEAAEMRKHFRTMIQDELAQLYAACLAAERDEEAIEVADVVFEQFDDADARIALIEIALEAEQAREHQLEWLDKAEASSGRKLTRLRAALEDALR